MILGKASELKFALLASNGRQQLTEWLEANKDVEVLDVKFDFDSYPKFLVIYRDNKN